MDGCLTCTNVEHDAEADGCAARLALPFGVSCRIEYNNLEEMIRTMSNRIKIQFEAKDPKSLEKIFNDNGVDLGPMRDHRHTHFGRSYRESWACGLTLSASSESIGQIWFGIDTSDGRLYNVDITLASEEVARSVRQFLTGSGYVPD